MDDFVYLSEVIQRLDDIPLDGELEQDELLGQPVLRLAAELQHLPAVDDRSRTSGRGQVEDRDTIRQRACVMQCNVGLLACPHFSWMTQFAQHFYVQTHAAWASAER